MGELRLLRFLCSQGTAIMRMMPTEAELRAILRIDLVYFAVGVLILTVGALTLIQSLVDRLRQHMVFLFGLVGLLYGTRLLFQTVSYTHLTLPTKRIV